ncbi:MAG: NAD(P)-dependent alcohol dehydrogenase [Salinivirgaceae bacterium]|jgi:NADPH:quinone reductase-like Zn-dependent oxidoreductase|nr:NAD(P)-dependent alcohol dehydrogenase [Salinivirgaceae bacterium]
MKAIIHSSYKSPDLLQIKEIPKPVPNENEVLIKVHATTVNRTDCANLWAKPFIMRFFTGLFKPKKSILGTDFAGEIVAMGNKVNTYKIGDRVFGFGDMGVKSHAEYMTFEENDAMALIPEKANYEQAAASIEGAHYARNIINKVPIKKGDKILVNGATGAIGSACVQLLKQYNAEVTAVCDGKHEELVKSIGAKSVIDYTQQDFTQMDLKFKYVFDAVGKNTFGKCKQVLEPMGIYISSELGPMIQNLFYALFTPLTGGKKVIFPYPTDRLKSVKLIQKLLAEGEYKPVIDKRYSMDEIAEAFKYAKSGKKIGNIILNIH